MKKISILFLIIVLPYLAMSQMSFKIKGQISDSLNLQGIPFATVTITKSADKKVVKKFAADVDGRFETNVNIKGNYELLVNSIGLSPITKNFIIKGDNDVIDFGKILLHEANTELGTVQVIADKPLVKVDVDKIAYSAESDPEAKTSTALDMLRKVPLVTVDGDDNIQVKGNSNFKIFLNGKPSTMITNNPSDFLKNFPANMIKNIEVITSPGAKYDAEGVGGIINIITMQKKVNGYTGSVNAGANSFGGANLGIFTSATIGKFGFSFNVSGNYNKNPTLPSITDRTNYLYKQQEFINYDGTSNYTGYFPWGNGELSYEFDTLNLISGSFNFWLGRNKGNSNSTVTALDSFKFLNQRYGMYSSNDYTFGNPGGNIDYQHTFKQNKEQIFTLSYQINFNPSTTKSATKYDSIYNATYPNINSNNQAYMIEQTFQADYVQPMDKAGKIDVGVKYILRENSSVTDANIYNPTLKQYVPDSTNSVKFDNNYYIAAGYLSYNVKYHDFGFKTGLRVENSIIDGIFTSGPYKDFSNKSLEYVPSANISYQSSPSQTFGLSYTKRIQRPGIWYLNPYVNKTDPLNISYGNPNLTPEHYHNFDLNFNKFGKFGNLNMDLYYTFSDNAIDRISQTKGDTIISTFQNIDIVQTWGLSTYLSLKLGQKFTANINGSVNHNQMKSNNETNLSNGGWGFNTYTNLQYTIVKGFRASIWGWMYQPAVRLETKSSFFYNCGATVNKEFFDGKLTFSLSARNPFWHDVKQVSQTIDPNYYQETTNYRPGRSFSFNISFRFGEMNKQIKKPQNGINNDDMKKSDGEGGS